MSVSSKTQRVFDAASNFARIWKIYRKGPSQWTERDGDVPALYRAASEELAQASDDLTRAQFDQAISVPELGSRS